MPPGRPKPDYVRSIATKNTSINQSYEQVDLSQLLNLRIYSGTLVAAVILLETVTRHHFTHIKMKRINTLVVQLIMFLRFVEIPSVQEAKYDTLVNGRQKDGRNG